MNSMNSKLMAIVVVVLVILGGVYMYMSRTSQGINETSNNPQTQTQTETPDGTVLTPLNTPTATSTSPTPVTTSTSPTAGPGEHCGGNMTTARVCTTGYKCAPEPGSHLPFGDVGGICVSNK